MIPAGPLPLVEASPHPHERERTARARVLHQPSRRLGIGPGLRHRPALHAGGRRQLLEHPQHVLQREPIPNLLRRGRSGDQQVGQERADQHPGAKSGHQGSSARGDRRRMGGRGRPNCQMSSNWRRTSPSGARSANRRPTRRRGSGGGRRSCMASSRGGSAAAAQEGISMTTNASRRSQDWRRDRPRAFDTLGPAWYLGAAPVPACGYPPTQPAETTAESALEVSSRWTS